MEFFLNDPNVKRLPPNETRLLELRANPYPDQKRIRVVLELTPFQKRPYIELFLADSTGDTASTANIVEPVGWKLELTLHVRTAPADGNLTLLAILSYPELGEIDRLEINIDPKSAHEPSE
jgi:hypothetical protein